MSKLTDVIKPSLRYKLKTQVIPNFLPHLDVNKKYQAEIWDDKTYKVNPRDHIFTTIQEHFGNRLIQSLHLPPTAVVVDIGCFIGEKLWQLSKSQPYLGIGVDIAISSLQAAQKIDIYGHTFIAADMENLPFSNNSVDLVMVFDVIEHLTHAEKGFSEVTRVLKPGGQFLLHIPILDNTWSMFWWKQKLFPSLAQQDYANVGHATNRMLTSSQIKNQLNKNGLILNKEIYFNSFLVHFWDREFLPLIARLLVGKRPRTQGIRATHMGQVGLMRNFYGKYIVPILEIMSRPDLLLSKLKIGNTYFVLATKL